MESSPISQMGDQCSETTDAQGHTATKCHILDLDLESVWHQSLSHCPTLLLQRGLGQTSPVTHMSQDNPIYSLGEKSKRNCSQTFHNLPLKVNVFNSKTE